MAKKKQRARTSAKKKITARKGKSAAKRAPAKKKAKKALRVNVRHKPSTARLAEKRGRERRAFKRVSLKNLWVTELSGDYRFVAIARDISEGGIFLNGRLKVSQEASVIQLPLNGRSVELTAMPIYDRLSKGGYGTGYRFVDLTKTQTKELQRFISRNKRG